MILRVRVKPGSKAPGVSVEDGITVVRVRERAIEGAANAACITALAAHLGVPKSRIALKSGARSREKTFEIG